MRHHCLTLSSVLDLNRSYMHALSQNTYLVVDAGCYVVFVVWSSQG